MPMTNDAPAQASVATWHPLDENGWAELRVNGKRITTFASYPAAEEAAERINEALSPPPTVGAEDEAVGWMHPTARWFAPNRDTVAMHCTPDKQPVRVYTRPAPAADGQRVKDLEDAVLACERGQTIYNVLANYRTVRRTIQDIRASLASEKGCLWAAVSEGGRGSDAPATSPSQENEGHG